MEGKQRLRPWLEAQINSGEIPGLHWLNEDKTKFQIPWKHGGKQDWNPDSGRIFKEWARHTGRFREGIDEPDFVKWKTRLRCAFNKAPDIEEVKDESQLEGPNPFRVYLLKPRKNGKKTEPEIKINPFPAAAQFSGTQTNAPLPAMLENITMMSTESFPSDLKDLKSGDMLKFEGLLNDDVIMLSDNFHSLTLGKEKIEVKCENDMSMNMKIFYSGKEVMDKMVTASLGCRVYYSTFAPMVLSDMPEWITPLVYETQGVDFLCLPPCDGLMDSPKQQKFWQDVLEKGLTDGICIATHDYDIYALRFCACQIYYASECGTSGDPKPLKRHNKDSQALTKIFDYHNDFVPAFNQFLAGLGAKPSASVSLIVGTELPLLRLSSYPGIHVTVESSKALADLQEFQGDQVISSDEKLAAAILHYETLIKTEPENTTQRNSGWNCLQGASMIPDSFIPNLEAFSQPEFIIEDGITAVGNNSTLDFGDLCDLGFDLTMPCGPEF